MHLESCLKPQKEEETPSFSRSAAPPLSGLELDRELAEIFRRTYGEPKHSPHRMYTPKEYLPATKKPTATVEPREKYLLVDGYNIVFAWDELRELSKINIESARSKLIDILCNYQGYRKMNLILVFDAYRVERNQGESFPFRNIHIIYTKTAETADQYIEKTVHQIGRKYDVTVATSDALEQLIIFGEGAKRISARELRIEVENTMEEIRREYQELAQTEKNRPLMEPLMDQLDADSLSRIGRP